MEASWPWSFARWMRAWSDALAPPHFKHNKLAASSLTATIAQRIPILEPPTTRDAPGCRYDIVRLPYQHLIIFLTPVRSDISSYDSVDPGTYGSARIPAASFHTLCPSRGLHPWHTEPKGLAMTPFLPLVPNITAPNHMYYQSIPPKLGTFIGGGTHWSLALLCD